MKYIYMIFAALISFSALNAMDTPDITQWQEICKDLEKKQQLVTVYKKFCKKRFELESTLTVGSWSLLGLMIAGARKVPDFAAATVAFSVVLIPVALCKTVCLPHAVDRYNLAKQGNLSYLNHDVLEQLGNPRVYEGSSVFEVEDFKKGNSYSKRGSGYSRDLIPTSKLLAVNNVEGIEEVLSGKKIKVILTEKSRD